MRRILPRSRCSNHPHANVCLRVVGALCASLLFSFSAPAQSDAHTSDVPAEVWAGEVWVGRADRASDDAPTFVAQAIIDAPPSVVWQIVSRCDDFSRIMPRVLASKELSRKGDNVVCQVTIDMPFPLSDLTSVTAAVHREDATLGNFSREWKLVKGDYQVNEGAWILRALPNGKRTLATYRVTARPNIPVPSSLAALFQQGPLVKSMQAVREESRVRMTAPKP